MIRNTTSQIEFNTLIKFYQSGMYQEAEKLALLLTEKYPTHELGWKILAAILYESGRLNELLVANERIVSLVPNEAESHFNLGITLVRLGRLKDAETSLKRSINLKPQLEDAHYILGNIHQALGRLEEAEEYYKQVCFACGLISMMSLQNILIK